MNLKTYHKDDTAYPEAHRHPGGPWYFAPDDWNLLNGLYSGGYPTQEEAETACSLHAIRSIGWNDLRARDHEALAASGPLPAEREAFRVYKADPNKHSVMPFGGDWYFAPLSWPDNRAFSPNYLSKQDAAEAAFDWQKAVTEKPPLTGLAFHCFGPVPDLNPDGSIMHYHIPGRRYSFTQHRQRIAGFLAQAGEAVTLSEFYTEDATSELLIGCAPEQSTRLIELSRHYHLDDAGGAPESWLARLRALGRIA